MSDKDKVFFTSATGVLWWANKNDTPHLWRVVRTEGTKKTRGGK